MGVFGVIGSQCQSKFLTASSSVALDRSQGMAQQSPLSQLVQDNLCDMGQARAVFPDVVTVQ
jgi:hypothetical protein